MERIIRYFEELISEFKGLFSSITNYKVNQSNNVVYGDMTGGDLLESNKKKNKTRPTIEQIFETFSRNNQTHNTIQAGGISKLEWIENDTTVKVCGKNISIVNGNVWVDGKQVHSKQDAEHLTVVIENINVDNISIEGNAKVNNYGYLNNLVTQGNLVVDGYTTVGSNVDKIASGGNMTIKGDLKAVNVRSGGNVSVSGSMTTLTTNKRVS
jgi:hypothetical protein